MDPAYVAGLVTLAAGLFTALFGFWGVWVASKRALQAAQFTQRAATRAAAEGVEVDRAKVLTDGFEHLADQHRKDADGYRQEILRLHGEYAAKIVAIERAHRDEMEPLKRYASALQKGADEKIFEASLLIELKRRTVTHAYAVIRERAAMAKETQARDAERSELLAEIERLRATTLAPSVSLADDRVPSGSWVGALRARLGRWLLGEKG
jgi:predicted membrane metal-binding protein